MQVSEQTLNQIGNILKTVATGFPASEEALPLTDLYLQVKPDSGEVTAIDDDDRQICSGVVDEWVENTDENFYDEIQPTLKRTITKSKEVVEAYNILKPFSIVLVDADKEIVADLYYVDDDIITFDGELMKGLDADLDEFWEKLSKEE